MFEPRIYSQIAWPLCGATRRFANGVVASHASPSYTVGLCRSATRVCCRNIQFCKLKFIRSLLSQQRLFPPHLLSYCACWTIHVSFTRMSLSFWIGSPPFSLVHWQNNFSSVTDKNVNGASKVCSIVCLEQAVDCLILSVKSKNCLSISSLQIDF